MSKSIIQTNKRCYLCETTYNLHKHHIFFGNANRKISEKEGMWVWLCANHHNMSNDSVHSNRDIDLSLRRVAQGTYEQTHTREEFRSVFGKSWL